MCSRVVGFEVEFPPRKREKAHSVFFFFQSVGFSSFTRNCAIKVSAWNGGGGGGGGAAATAMPEIELRISFTLFLWTIAAAAAAAKWCNRCRWRRSPFKFRVALLLGELVARGARVFKHFRLTFWALIIHY